MKVIQKPTNKFSSGRGGHKVAFIVIHWIVGTLAAADAVFASSNTKRQASAHYAIGQKVIHQYVKGTDTAWHCGNFVANQRSIGIEHEGGPNLPITSQVYKNSAWIIARIWQHYGKLPLYPHSKFMATQCPGTIDLKKLEKLAAAEYKILTTPPKPPVVPSKPLPPKKTTTPVVAPKSVPTVKKEAITEPVVEGTSGRTPEVIEDTNMIDKLKAVGGSMRFWMTIIGAVVAYFGNVGIFPAEFVTVVLGFLGVGITVRTLDNFSK